MTSGYALLSPSEDGNPFRRLSPSELADLLANPSDWGVAEFGDLDALGSDSNYWPDKVGVLIRYEQVTPEHAGYRLPPADPDAGHWRAARADGTPIKLGDVL